MQIISNIALVSINETMFVQLISFLIFLFIINRVMIRPLRRTMSTRGEHIEKIQQEITSQQNDLNGLEKEIRKKESRLRTAAVEIRKKLEDAGSHEAASILSATRKEIEAIRKQSARDVAHTVSVARRDLKQESERLVPDIIEKVLDRRP